MGTDESNGNSEQVTRLVVVKSDMVFWAITIIGLLFFMGALMFYGDIIDLQTRMRQAEVAIGLYKS